MNKRKVDKIMKTIGKQEGISAKEVEREIQIAIDSGFDNPDARSEQRGKKYLLRENDRQRRRL